MPQSPLSFALVSAAAAAGGGVAHVMVGTPGATIAASAVLGGLAAALAAVGSDAAPERPRPRPQPVQIPETRPDRPVLEALPSGLMIIDGARRVTFANTSIRQIFGNASMEGVHVSLLRANRLTERIEAAMSQRAGSTLEFSLSRAGDASLRAHIRPLEDGTVLVAVEDETQRRRAEEVHRDFVANASHELKTPLAASSGIVETLLGHARSDPEASERFLGLLQTQIRRMTGLIEDLLSLNRIELNARILPREPQNLAAIVGETVDVLTPVAEAAGVTLALRPAGLDVEVIGDHDQLAQLFANLVDNAIKYSGAGTTVTISADPGPEEPGMVGVSVGDQGIGIAREHLPRLTERFYRVNIRRSREAGGTGLGLAIVKHILNRHRGRLAVESEEGKGSRFTAWLPVATQADRTPDDAVVTELSQN